MDIEKIQQKIDLVGFHKVACRILKEEGTDYGNPDELDLVKVAEVLGTKLAMIHRNRNYFLNGVRHLKEI
ncbi:MAG: hypothetical protein ACTSPI_00115 [Candidatus Heimdallarchaeaceae archaeon]